MGVQVIITAGMGEGTTHTYDDATSWRKMEHYLTVYQGTTKLAEYAPGRWDHVRKTVDGGGAKPARVTKEGSAIRTSPERGNGGSKKAAKAPARKKGSRTRKTPGFYSDGESGF